MTKSDNPIVQPVASSTERAQLDWAFHAGIVDQVLEKVDMKVKRRQTRRRRIGSGAAALVIVAFVFLWGVPYVQETSTVATPAAHRETLALSDGSHADLNAQTKMHTDFRYGRRMIRVDQGEAFFSVTKDVEHPFLVRTPAGIVRVTGTQFNVRLIDNRQVEVTLLEGAILVERPNAELVTLSPGQQISLDQGKPSVRTLSVSNLESVIAWRQGRLMLDGLTLSEVAARLAAYHGKEISVDPDVVALRPGGSVPIDNLRGALDALQDTLPIRVMPRAEDSFRIIRR